MEIEELIRTLRTWNFNQRNPAPDFPDWTYKFNRKIRTIDTGAEFLTVFIDKDGMIIAPTVTVILVGKDPSNARAQHILQIVNDRRNDLEAYLRKADLIGDRE